MDRPGRSCWSTDRIWAERLGRKREIFPKSSGCGSAGRVRRSKANVRRESEEARVALANELSANGLRATRQRLVVLRLLRSVEGHPTVLELHRLVRREVPNVSRKTVYEILDSFVREGLAACVTDGGEPYRYETRTSPHYHARCRICGHLYDLRARADGPIRGLTDVPEGFRIEAINVTLRGVCLRCRDEI